MNWSDERYVRLYTRDTVTWKTWTWETRAILGLLIRKVDRSGVLETGRGDKVGAFALLLEIPREVAERTVAQLLACGTMTEGDSAYVLPTFVQAQEAKQSDRTRQAESRGKRAAAAATKRNDEDACHTPSQPVTDRHSSRAVPSRAEPAVPSRADVSAAPNDEKKIQKAKRKAEQPALIEVHPPEPDVGAPEEASTPEPKELTPAQKCQSFWEGARLEKLEAIGAEPVPEELPAAWVFSFWSRALKQAGSYGAVTILIDKFLEEDWPIKNPKFPPYGLGAFASEHGFKKLLAAYEAEYAA